MPLPIPPADEFRTRILLLRPCAVRSNLEELFDEDWLIKMLLGSLLSGEVSRLHLQVLISGVRLQNLHVFISKSRDSDSKSNDWELHRPHLSTPQAGNISSSPLRVQSLQCFSLILAKS